MDTSRRRDFLGYGGNPPHPHWPEEARVAVSFVVNLEEGAELSVADGDERNETIFEVTEELVGLPHYCMESHFEYGTRAGYWRIMEVLDRFNVKATLNACARALQRSPWLGWDALRRGHEIACHGYRWEDQAQMDRAQERAMISRAVETIERVVGVRPVGWHTRTAPSVNTRELLVEDGGFIYDSNAYNDDLPYLIEVHAQAHVVLPYSFDTNDMRFHANRGFSRAEDFAGYCKDAFDWLWQEGEHQPKMMSVGLHPRIIGRPGRMRGLEDLLRHMVHQGQVWFARRDAIARHWRSLNGLPI